MASIMHQATLTNLPTFLPAAPASAGWAVFEENRHRVYALAFWMTDHELLAEEVMQRVFSRAFALESRPSPEAIDRALIMELRAFCEIGPLTLSEPTCEQVLSVRRNTLRVHLERAVVQLPPTERMIFLLHDVEGYGHDRISRLLGITTEESQFGLHQSRVHVRRLVASMPR